MNIFQLFSFINKTLVFSECSFSKIARKNKKNTFFIPTLQAMLFCWVVKKWIVLLCLLWVGFGALAQEPNRYVPVPKELEGFQAGVLAAFIWDGSYGSHEWNNLQYDFAPFIEHEDENFGFAVSLGITNRNKFGIATIDPLRAVDFDLWLEINEGIFYFEQGPVYFYGGLAVNSDRVSTPYSLFLSSQPNVFGPSTAFGYQGETFGLKSIWLGLNAPDNVFEIQRGANYQEYFITIGPVRFGYQELVVYHNKFFDPIFFLSPIPAPLMESIYSGLFFPSRTTKGTNSMIGTFFEYQDDRLYIPIQLQLDDLTSKRILKFGWSLGVKYDFDIGSIGLYHAGATKHTYSSAIYDDPDNKRSYRAFTYAPSNRYGATNSQGQFTEQRTFWYFDNYIGYKYGENNLAFLVDYSNRFSIVDIYVDLYVALEYVVSGAKSPINPWHEDDDQPERSGFLDDDILSHTLALDVGLGIDIFEDVTAVIEGSIGVAINQLRLDHNDIFSPTQGVAPLYYLFLGVRYNYNQHAAEWREKARTPPNL